MRTFQNAVVEVWRSAGSGISGNTLVEGTNQRLLEKQHASIQYLSNRQRESLIGRLPDVEYRVRIHGVNSYILQPGDIVKITAIDRRFSRFERLIGRVLLVEAVDDTPVGRVGLCSQGIANAS